MDPYNFLRNLDSRTPFLGGLNGLNPLATLSGINLEPPAQVNVRGKSKITREEAAVEAKIVEKILSSQWDSLKPNSGKVVSIGDHQICVSYQEDIDSGYRIWEWHGHLLMFDEEDGYSPEYVYGNYFQLLEKKKSEDEDEEKANRNKVNGRSKSNGKTLGLKNPSSDSKIASDLSLGLGSLIVSDEDKKLSQSVFKSSVLHRSGKKDLSLM